MRSTCAIRESSPAKRISSSSACLCEGHIVLGHCKVPWGIIPKSGDPTHYFDGEHREKVWAKLWRGWRPYDEID